MEKHINEIAIVKEAEEMADLQMKDDVLKDEVTPYNLPDCCMACIHCHEIGSPKNSKFICDLNLSNNNRIKCIYADDEY